MTSKHSITSSSAAPSTSAAAGPPTTSSLQQSSAAASASRAAAQILYRMANSSSSITTEPITPVFMASTTMLQPAPAHFAVSSANFVGSASGHVAAHQSSQNPSFIPVYIHANQTGIKQEPGLPLQISYQQQQQLLNAQQQQQQQRFVNVSNSGDPSQMQIHSLRMANGSSPSLMMSGSGAGGPGYSSSKKGRGGGRRPMKDEKLTPEEEERRRVRRDRNKQAAARCRKRRMDHTNVLLEETEGLEDQQSKLKEDIEALQQEKVEIEFILQSHRTTCMKEFITRSSSPLAPMEIPPTSRSESSASSSAPNDAATMPPPATSTSVVPSLTVAAEPASTGNKKPHTNSSVTRPASLPVKSDLQQTGLHNLALPTPSPTKLIFNFEHSGLTPTGLTPTGLTPLVPSCSSEAQNKSPPRSQPSDASEGASPNLVSL